MLGMLRRGRGGWAGGTAGNPSDAPYPTSPLPGRTNRRDRSRPCGSTRRGLNAQWWRGAIVGAAIALALSEGWRLWRRSPEELAPVDFQTAEPTTQGGTRCQVRRQIPQRKGCKPGDFERCPRVAPFPPLPLPPGLPPSPPSFSPAPGFSVEIRRRVCLDLRLPSRVVPVASG